MDTIILCQDKPNSVNNVVSKKNFPGIVNIIAPLQIRHNYAHSPIALLNDPLFPLSLNPTIYPCHLPQLPYSLRVDFYSYKVCHVEMALTSPFCSLSA